VLLALVVLVLGSVILFRPTTSLGTLAFLIGAGSLLNGVLELASILEPTRVLEATRAAGKDRPNQPVQWAARSLGLLWIAAGIFVLVYPGLTVRLVAVLVGVGLILSGVVSVLRAFRKRAGGPERVAAAGFGGASIIFGGLALWWPDITLLIVSLVFGARLILGAIELAWRTFHGPRTTAARPHGSFRRWATAIVAVVAILGASGAAAVSYALASKSPVVDDFYASPRDVPAGPGKLIRAEPFTRDVPDDALGWRILYTTTSGDGTATTASALVVVPRSGAGAWPVIDWNHGTTGYAQNCAPSLAGQPFGSGALFVVPEIIEHGWALVATDYPGLGAPGTHPYLVGKDSAHASLDAVRAARQLSEARLGAKTTVWGHSQGGGAALWTAAVAREYAPDVPLSGVAALAPAANLPALVSHLPQVTGGSIFGSFAFAAYANTYPDVTWRDYIRPGAEATVRAMSQRCLAEPGALVSVLDVLGLSNDPQVFAKDPLSGPFGQRLRENVPPATMTAPVLLAQGAADTLIVPTAQKAYVDGLCSAGVAVDYRTYQGLDHVPLVEERSRLIPQLLDWTSQRFAGAPATAKCTTTAG